MSDSINGRCLGMMGSLFGHRFQGRYDEVKELPPELASGLTSIKTTSVNGGASGMASFMNTKRTYLHDICVRCGETKEGPR